MPNVLDFLVEPEGQNIQVPIGDLVIAGWTGRDVEALEAHITELEQLGVPRPSSVPCFYRVGENQFTNNDEIQVLGDTSSGEVEFVLIGTEEGMLIGVGSDHTDREVETYSVPVSKQMCPKPVSKTLWHFDDVAAHFEQLTLTSWVTETGKKSLYQEGPVTTMRAPAEIIDLYLPGNKTLPTGTAMYCGTLAAIGGIRPGTRFDVEIVDPVLERKITFGYKINSLPIIK